MIPYTLYPAPYHSELTLFQFHILPRSPGRWSAGYVVQLFDHLGGYDSSSYMPLYYLIDYHRHVDYGSRARRNLLGSPSQWINLHLGSGKCRSQICEVLWIRRCVVGMYSLDDLCGWKLSSQWRFLCLAWYSD
jgi:hypothetical protein